MKRLGVLMTHVYNDDVISSMVSCWPLLVYIKYVYMYVYIYISHHSMLVNHESMKEQAETLQSKDRLPPNL